MNAIQNDHNDIDIICRNTAITVEVVVEVGIVVVVEVVVGVVVEVVVVVEVEVVVGVGVVVEIKHKQHGDYSWKLLHTINHQKND